MAAKIQAVPKSKKPEKKKPDVFAIKTGIKKKKQHLIDLENIGKYFR